MVKIKFCILFKTLNNWYLAEGVLEDHWSTISCYFFWLHPGNTLFKLHCWIGSFKLIQCSKAMLVFNLSCNGTKVHHASTWNGCANLWLTHWGRAMHICIGKLTIISSDNGLSPGRRQAIIRTNAGILLIGTLGTNFSEILSENVLFSFKTMHLKMSSGRWRPFCLGLSVLTHWGLVLHRSLFGILHSAHKICQSNYGVSSIPLCQSRHGIANTVKPLIWGVRNPKT